MFRRHILPMLLFSLLAALLPGAAASQPALQTATGTQPFNVKINFQPASSTIPLGFLPDSGAVFGARDNGYTYGWNADNSANMRDRLFGRVQYDTLARMQSGGSYTWEIAVPNGSYTVKIAAGDADFFDSVYKLNVEGVALINGTPTSANRWLENYARVTVSDGKLTVSNAAGATNNKINFIEIYQFMAKVNFQPASAPVPQDYKADTGAVFGARGSGFSYGWNADNSANMRARSTTPQLYDTLARTQNGGSYTWEIAVPNGAYQVHLVSGDPDFFDSVYKVNVEGVLTINGTPTIDNRFFEATRTVSVSDGRLTISNASGAVNNKLNFVEIWSSTLFHDTFDRTLLGPEWIGSGWEIVNNELYSNQGGYGATQTAKRFGATDYVLESKVRGLAPTGGPGPGDTIYLTFGGDGSGSTLEYRVAYSPSTFDGSLLRLLKRTRYPSGEINQETLASAVLSAAPGTSYSFKVERDDTFSSFKVYVDQGAGYGATPTLQANDWTYPTLGSFGWGIEREAPGDVYVESITARLR